MEIIVYEYEDDNNTGTHKSIGSTFRVNIVRLWSRIKLKHYTLTYDVMVTKKHEGGGIYSLSDITFLCLPVLYTFKY